MGAAVDVPHFHHQCLTSVAPVLPLRNESITLNNVNVSPSQHKTNNHRSLPFVLRTRGSLRTTSFFFTPFSRVVRAAFHLRQRGLIKNQHLLVNVFN